MKRKWLLYYKNNLLNYRLNIMEYSEKDKEKIDSLIAHDTFKKEEANILRKMKK